MKLIRPSRFGARRGAALLLSLLILFVLVAIVFQLSITTNTDARVGRNDVSLVTMDLVIESAMLEEMQLLISDGEAAQGGDEGAGADPGAAAGGDPAAAGAGEEGAEEGPGEEAVDSWRDEFMRPQRTEINGIQLRILVVDEDSKFNILNLANEVEEEADVAYEQLVRILDLCREETEDDIDRADAEEMASAIRDHITKRDDSILARPVLLTTNEDREDVDFPLSIRELSVLEPFDESHFRDYRDSDGNIAHSLEWFLTCWSSLAPAGEMSANDDVATSDPESETETEPDNEGGAVTGTAENGGGYAVNLNTSPGAVLKGLFDDRDLSHRFWDSVIEYRNLEEEEEGEDEDAEEVLDEFGEEVIQRQIFESLDELTEVDDYDRLEDDIKAILNSRLRVTSDVFSIIITARRSTSATDDYVSGGLGSPREDREAEIESGSALLRTVRAVVWRRSNGEEIECVPIVRWEVLDYVPFEYKDFPEDER